MQRTEPFSLALGRGVAVALLASLAAAADERSIELASAVQVQQAATRCGHRFDVSDEGTFGYLSGGLLEPATLVLRERATGEERHFPLGEHDLGAHVVWLGEERWLVPGSSDDCTRVVDAATGAIAIVEALCGDSVEHAAATGDGGFVAIWSGDVVRVGPDLWVAWRTRGEKLRFGILDALAVAPDGRILVLDDKRSSLHVLSSQGDLERSASLPSARATDCGTLYWGLELAADGTLLVALSDDLFDQPRFARLTPELELLVPLEPAHASGIRLGSTELHVDADGALWTTDGYAFLRIDERGNVVEQVGPPFSDDALHAIETMTLDDRGRAYCLDARTARVWVVEADGTVRRSVHDVDPRRFRSPLESMPQISVSDDGWLFLSETLGTNRRFQYGPDGTWDRLLPPDPVVEKGLAVAERRGGGYWIVGEHAAARWPRDGERPTAVVHFDAQRETSPGSYELLPFPRSYALADGGLLVARFGDRSSVREYGPDGTLRREIAPPKGRRVAGVPLAYGGAVCIPTSERSTEGERFALDLLFVGAGGEMELARDVPRAGWRYATRAIEGTRFVAACFEGGLVQRFVLRE